MLGALVRHDSCCCSSVSEPVLTAVFCNGLMWHKLCFLTASVRNVGPEALCCEGLLGTILAAVRVFRNRSSQLFSAMG